MMVIVLLGQASELFVPKGQVKSQIGKFYFIYIHSDTTNIYLHI